MAVSRVKKPYFPDAPKLTRDEYESLLYYQGGGCAICGRPPSPKRRLAADHDHHSNVFRGLLCYVCNNRLLGRGLERPELHEAAASYLRTPPAVEWRRSQASSLGELAGVVQP